MEQEKNWLLLLMKLDGLNRRVKEPGWTYEDKENVYKIKDRILELILKKKPAELELRFYYVPYYMYSNQSKDRAGDLMRRDTERRPFEYYLSQIEPCAYDTEVREKATVEIVINCLNQEFSFHQPISWFNMFEYDVDSFEKKAWINAKDFHHLYYETTKKEIEKIISDLGIN